MLWSDILSKYHMWTDTRFVRGANPPGYRVIRVSDVLSDADV